MSDLFTPTIARTAEAYANAGLNTTAASTKTTSTKASDNIGFMPSATSDSLTLTMENFLELLIVQFQNQDIDNQASTTDMMNQLIQMSTVQAMATMTDASTMSYAASLVGQTVTVGSYTSSGLEEIVGTVTGTGTYDGEQVIFVNDKMYPLSSIMAIGKIPENAVEGGEDVDNGENTDGTEGTGGTEGSEGTESGDTDGVDGTDGTDGTQSGTEDGEK